MGGDLNEVVDIRSGLAYLMVKWKRIALVMLAGALIGGCFGSMKGSKSQTEAAAGYEDTLRSARAACSEQGALYAEQLSAQYKAYNSELNRWGVYLENAALQKLDPHDFVKKDIRYQVITDSRNVVDAFSEALLDRSDQDAIGEALGIDPLTACAEELISVSGSSKASGTEPAGGEVPEEGAGSENGVRREIMTVSIAAGDESQADLLAAIVESAVDERCKKMQAGGVQLQMKKVDEVSTRNDSAWLLNRQQSALDRLAAFQINYSLFIKNTTDILQGAQRTYYNLLISLDPEKAAAGAVKKSGAKSALKYAVAGGAAGLVAALLCAYLLFVFSNKIRTGEELLNNYGISTLQRFKTGEPEKWDAIRRLGFSCLGMDRAAQITEDGAAPLYAELEKRAAGSGKMQVYLTCDCADEKARGSVGTLAGILSDETMTVIAGDPRDSEKDYKELLGSDIVVMAEVLCGSAKKDFRDILEICRRNELPVLGCITLLDPARC